MARNFFLSLIAGGIVGAIIAIILPTKKGASLDIVLGVVGGFLGNLFLRFFRAGMPAGFFGATFIQAIGALVLILIGRLIMDGKK